MRGLLAMIYLFATVSWERAQARRAVQKNEVVGRKICEGFFERLLAVGHA